MFGKNNELILIKAKNYTKSRIIGEQIFTFEVTFGDILKYFNVKLKTEFLNLKKMYTFNGIDLNETYQIKELINIPKDNNYLLEVKIEVNE